MLTPDQIEQFHRNGFLNGGPVLSESAVDELRDELKRVIDEYPRTGGKKPVLLRNLRGDADETPVFQVVNIWQASDPFASAMRHPKILEDIAQLSGAKELRIWHDQIQYKPAAKGGVNMWHQDSPLWPILWPQTQISAWIALDDVDEENGCMSMVPGSHAWGPNMEYLNTIEDYRKLPGEFGEHEVKPCLCPVKKGNVHYHHGLTWHGSHENLSGRPRRAIAFHYMTGDTTFKASGNHVMKSFVTVEDGATFDGDAFPVLWSRAG